MSAVFNTEYLEELFTTACKELSKDYDLSILNFGKFETINSYLIHRAIENEENIHLRTCKKRDNENFCLPAIVSVAVFGFLKNYIAYDPTPVVGEVIQKGRERYTIIKINDTTTPNRPIVIRNKANATIQYLTLESYKSYITTTAEKETDGRKLKIGFEHYRGFFESIFRGGVSNTMPSKFRHKYLVVSKETYDSLKGYAINDVNIFKSLPIRYVTGGGDEKNNIPIDPMIYIVSDYEVAKRYVIGKQDIDTIIVIGDSKYRDDAREIGQDIRAKRVKNVIFIGSEIIHNFEHLYQWNWTKPEQDYLSDEPYYESEICVAQNNDISDQITFFQKEIERIEYLYEISLLKDLSEYIRSASRVVLPTQMSRLENKLSLIKFEFERTVSDTLESLLFDRGVYDCEDEKNRLIEAFNRVIKSVGCHKWRTFIGLKKVKYVVAPKDHIEELKYELHNSSVKVLLYSELNKLKEKQPKVCFFSVYGKSHFTDCYLSDCFKPIFVLYPHEAAYLSSLRVHYYEDVNRELASKDRKLLSGIEYSSTPKYESIDEMMRRLFKSFDEDSVRELRRMESGDEINVSYRIDFENGEFEDVECTKSVLLCNANTPKIITADKLRTGDSVRLYANTNKDELWRIATANDTCEVFQSINDASYFWKQSLLQYKQDNGLSTEALFDRLKGNGMTIVKNHTTMDRWTAVDSETKFPADKRSLFAIKATINNPNFNERYGELLAKRKAYRGIMIGLGRDLSDELIQYIQSGGKVVGEILSKYDDKVRRGFADSNAPIRTIKKITTIQNEAHEE